MPWPLSQDYNEAIQDPASAFADASMRAGEVVVNALGLPMPRSGNFADVYEFRCPDGSRWAVKCFTREVAGLRERYHEISRELQESRLPFTVDFTYLEQGIRVRGRWFPILKMQWVEGLLLNNFVRSSLGQPGVLDALGQIWVRMARRLSESGIAHADLQHGNVILVPGSRASALALKLIDYDGMFVPALAGRKSGEVGHPAYQHPQRLREGTYFAGVDHVPLLAVLCALRCLILGGKALWERYDTGDNLLFREKDLQAPAQSALFKELWNLPDATAHDLVGHLTLALQGPVEKVPALEKLAAEEVAVPLTATQEAAVTALLGRGFQQPLTGPVKPVPESRLRATMAVPVGPAPVRGPAVVTGAPASSIGDVLGALLDDEEPRPGRSRARHQAPKSSMPWIVAGAMGLLMAVALGYVGMRALGGRGKAEHSTGHKKEHPGAKTGKQPGGLGQQEDAPDLAGPPGQLPGNDPGWVQMFNGKDLVGWQTVGAGDATWTVRDGILVAEAPFGHNHLFSVRGDYANFHLRVETKINTRGYGGFAFRATPAAGIPNGYVVALNSNHRTSRDYSGTLFLSNHPANVAAEYSARVAGPRLPLVPADTWFVLDITAIGNRLKIVVDGRPAVDFTDTSQTYRQGHLALLAARPQHKGSVVQFRKIEIKELPAPEPEPVAIKGWDHCDTTQAQVMDGFLRLQHLKAIDTRQAYAGPLKITARARTDRNNIRLRAGRGGEVIFNWELKKGEMRVHRPDDLRQGRLGSLAASKQVPLEPNTWYTLGWQITSAGTVVTVDGEVVFQEVRKYDLSQKQPVRLYAFYDSVVDLEWLTVTPLAEGDPVVPVGER